MQKCPNKTQNDDQQGGVSLQLIQMLQPRQNDLLACFLYFTGKKDLVEDGVDLEEGNCKE